MILKYKHAIIVVFGLIFCVFILTKCINQENNTISSQVKKDQFGKFSGSKLCIDCHKNIYDSHIKTAHYLTSAVATEKNIAGSFDAGNNEYHYSNGTLIRMEKRQSDYYQVAYINGVEKKRQKFDILFGSGTKGQTYASWNNNELVQLPITYFTMAHQWANSPGYPNRIAFNRPITSRCLECHSTFAEKVSADSVEPELFDKRRMILGVDCEKCHGPAQQHVAFHLKNPKDTIGKFIINPASFSRQQSLDMCTLCHGGRLQKSKPSFEFTPGDQLSDFFTLDTIAKKADDIDVHGNQAGLLAASKCFKMSKSLTCVTCHNTHENEKGKTALFSQRCMNCHNNGHTNSINCKLTNTIGKAIKKNCIDCHMPEQPSKAIAVLLQGNAVPTSAFMRNHNIRIYPEETKKILAYILNK